MMDDMFIDMKRPLSLVPVLSCTMFTPKHIPDITPKVAPDATRSLLYMCTRGELTSWIGGVSVYVTCALNCDTKIVKKMINGNFICYFLKIYSSFKIIGCFLSEKWFDDIRPYINLQVEVVHHQEYEEKYIQKSVCFIEPHTQPHFRYEKVYQEAKEQVPLKCHKTEQGPYQVEQLKEHEQYL
jgi:hypothetical protein